MITFSHPGHILVIFQETKFLVLDAVTKRYLLNVDDNSLLKGWIESGSGPRDGLDVLMGCLDYRIISAGFEIGLVSGFGFD